MPNQHWLRSVPLILWLLTATVCPTVARAGEIAERLFQDGAGWRSDHYVRARDAVLAEGEAIIPFLERKNKSTSTRERLFAKILISRINEPRSVETWHKNLMSLVEGRNVLQAARTYQELDWDKLPKEAADVPPSHLVDVIWQYADRDNMGEREVTAVALQFYLAPDIEALDAVMEVVPLDHAFRRLAKHAIIKLGRSALPRMREILAETVAMQPSVPSRSPNITQEQREKWRKYWPQKSRALVAAYVLSRLNDRESIQLIANCLTSYAAEYTYIEEFSEDLAYMKAIEAIDSMLNCTLKLAGKRWYKRNPNRPAYVVLRSHLKKLGPEALPALRRRLSYAEEKVDKVVLTNLIVELSGVKGKEKEVAELRESLWFNTTTADLLRIHELTGEDIFPRLRELMLRKRRRACLALGMLKEVRAVPILAKEIRKQHEYLKKKLGDRKTKQGAEPFDLQKAREGGYTFGRRETDLARVLAWGDTCLLALRRIGGDQAKTAIAKARTYPEYEARAKISLLLMENRTDEIAKHLRSKDRALREEAALALAVLERQDRRASRELLYAAARRQGPSHEQWKEYALSSSKNISPILRELAKSESIREQVLTDAMILELESPEKSELSRLLLQKAVSHISMMHVQRRGGVERISMVESAGRSLATKIDERSVPLLEAECLFGQDVIRRGIAAYALAEFKKPRSMYVLAESLNMGSLGVSNPAALALADYGEKGAELAADVPPPTPGEYDTGLRMTRHRGGVRVLAELKDIRGVDEIIKGLKTLEKDRSLDMWRHRMNIYLDAAGRFHDARLVDPLLRILSISENPESYHHVQTINLLSAYDDDRLVPLFTQCLGTLNPSSDDPTHDTLYGVAVTALTRRIGENTPEYLIKQFNESSNNRTRAASLLALGELSYPTRPAFPGNGRWSIDRFKTHMDRQGVAAKARRLAYPVLVKALKNPSVDISRMAALGLTILATGNTLVAPDLRAVGELNEWCRMHNASFYALTEFLGANGNTESGEVLLAVLQSQPPTNGDVHIVFAMSKLKPKGAVPVLVRNIKAKAPGYSRQVRGELEALAKLGEEGTEALLDVFNSTKNLACRVAAACLLGEARNKNAADAIAGLLTKVAKAGHRGYYGTLLEALADLDAERAKIQAQNVLLNGPEELKHIALKVWSESK